MKTKHVILLVLALLLIVGGVVGWLQYREIRANYDAYRTTIQRGAAW